MINNCAFVVPLHPKHFNYGYYIFNYLNNKNVGLYFIFTDNNDKDNFVSKLNNTHVNYLILSDFANIEIVNKANSFVSIKKLFALSLLYEKYDFISCIDAEVNFINDKNDYYNIMKNIVDTKIICGGTLSDDAYEKNIVSKSLLRLTDVRYHKQLEEVSHNFRIYTWWCNLPVYDCKICKEFLEWINFSNTNLERFCWDVFDDITYNFFCILLHNYKLKPINNCGHSLEFAESTMVQDVDKTLCKLYWVNKHAYNQNKIYYENNDFRIVFHLDRW